MYRKAIREAYCRGETIEEIARVGGCSVEEAEIYLTAWCSAGCPENGYP
jgi:DNA-directed RNA polymerase specialized sigma24 family protein